MSMRIGAWTRGLLMALAVVFWNGAAHAAWPGKPIRVLVGWSAGGSSDITTRALAMEMERELDGRVLVTNVKGAHGSIGGSRVAKGRPDGYQWFGGAAVQGTWPVMGYGDVSWRDYYAMLSVMLPTTIYVKADAPWKDLGELLAAIKSSKKGKFKYGHPGIGSNGQIFAGLVLNSVDGNKKVTAIPYGGGREAGRYLLSGQIKFASVTMGDLTDWAVAGRVRPLANLYSKDIEFEGINFPAVTHTIPSLAAYEAINPFYGVYLPRKTPSEIVEKTAAAFSKAIKTKKFETLAIKERAGILLPRLGRASDEQMSKIASARGWALQQLGIARHSPEKFEIPKLEDWQWPPNKAAAQVRPWPKSVESMKP
jgi:tripartite-type tricarboxylate transporter receptor subunit TctC